MKEEFIIGKRRRRIEDSIVQRYDQVNFSRKQCAWLEDENFWDFVFSWYELVQYYEESGDNAIGAHLLDLYAHCDTLFRQAASDGRLTERRRDKAADALYQITYYVNQMAIQVRRNGLELASSVSPDIARKRIDDADISLN